MATPYVQRYRSGMGRQYQTTIRDVLNAERQRARLEGRALTPSEREGIIRGIMLPYVEAYGYGLERASEREGEEKRFEQTQNLREEELDLQKKAAVASAIGQGVQTGLLGAGLYGYGKGAGWWGGTTAAEVAGTTMPTTVSPYVYGTEGFYQGLTGGAAETTLPTAASMGQPAAYSAGQTAAVSGGAEAVAPTLGAQFAAGAPVTVPVALLAAHTLMRDNFEVPKTFATGVPEAAKGIGEAAIGVPSKVVPEAAKGIAGAGGEVYETGKTIVKAVGGGCIIVTACHGRDSEEVAIAREYRDKFLDKDTLRGYYMLAEILVPFMNNNDAVKHAIKKNLVNALISVGKVKLNGGPESLEQTKLAKYWKDLGITDAFLNTCKVLGMQTKGFTRSNGEVV